MDLFGGLPLFRRDRLLQKVRLYCFDVFEKNVLFQRVRGQQPLFDAIGITSRFCFIETRFRCIPPGVVAKTRRRPTKPKVFAPSQAGASKPLFSTDKGAGSYSVPVPYIVLF